MQRLKALLNNRSGGTLLITVVSLSLMILLLMSAATVKLAEVARVAARANEQLRYINAMEDLAQALARARILGAAVDPVTSLPVNCPANTTADTSSGLRLCVPVTGSGGGAGVTGICVDLDQAAITTHDRYCIHSLSVPAAVTNNAEAPFKSQVAQIKSFGDKLKTWASEMFQISKSHAQCAWYGCGAVGNTGQATPSAYAAPTAMTFAGPFNVLPTGTAVEKTPSATWTARNNTEPWSPTLDDWVSTNEIYLPACDAANQYWIGCMRCDYSGVTCLKMRVCPPKTASCASPYEQTIAIW